MNYYNNDYDRGYTEATMSAADYMARTYRWMAAGLVVTFAVALLTIATPLFYVVNSLYLVLTIAELALVFTLSARLQRMSVGAARGVFLAYSALNGMVLSYYFLLFSVNTLVMAFLSTAVYFGLMAFYGHTTSRDLTSWGPKLMMGLMAMLVTGLVGSLFGFGVGASLLYSGIGLVVFMLLTAYDTQKLHQMYAYYAADSELAEKASVYGALTLYLDFINIFLLCCACWAWAAGTGIKTCPPFRGTPAGRKEINQPKAPVTCSPRGRRFLVLSGPDGIFGCAFRPAHRPPRRRGRQRR